ncbi:dipeptide/oligopeptide/nickel ABC transporter permease/ATP-binding protein [Microlunatus sp. GCM10028923]|uniref:dipeptide/oligopeptide/nickel ABC transporter permease/ATP-binding protein n=1 Tax=Microlunatus sp. GCM10028923 TaxID=3273400 RepID=UPI003610ACF1
MTAGPVVEPADVITTGRRPSVLRALLGEPVGLVCTVFLVLVVLTGLLAPLIAPFDPNLTQIGLTNAPPFSGDYLLGGDAAGRDTLSRLLWATRSTMIACLVVLVSSVAVGVTSGLLAGFYRGRVEIVANWLSDTIIALPGMILLIALYAVIGTSTTIAMAVFGLMIAPTYYRLVRGVVAQVRSELFVDAAYVAGLSDARIIFKHVLGAVRPPVIIQSSFVLAAGIGIQAGLAFLGLGDPKEASWGGMLQLAFRNIYINRSAVAWPAVVITITVLALVLLGNALRDAMQQGTRNAELSRRTRRRLELSVPVEHPDRPAPDPVVDTEPELLTVRGLRIGYPGSDGAISEVVHGIDLSVRRGEIRGLVGESGSGKSQTVFAILDILPREAVVLGGSVQVGDTEILRRPALKAMRGRRIAYVPQEPMTNLDPTMTVGQQLTYGLRAVRPISNRQARTELLELLGSVGIRDPQRVFDSYPHQISGGMAQRVLITGAVASDPDLILADEPTTALDVTVQADVLEILRELRDQRGLGMILVTHNLGVVADLCDTVSVMRSGEIVESADCRTLFASPQHEYTKVLIAAAEQGDHVA